MEQNKVSSDETLVGNSLEQQSDTNSLVSDSSLLVK